MLTVYMHIFATSRFIRPKIKTSCVFPVWYLLFATVRVGSCSQWAVSVSVPLKPTGKRCQFYPCVWHLSFNICDTNEQNGSYMELYILWMMAREKYVLCRVQHLQKVLANGCRSQLYCTGIGGLGEDSQASHQNLGVTQKPVQMTLTSHWLYVGTLLLLMMFTMDGPRDLEKRGSPHTEHFADRSSRWLSAQRVSLNRQVSKNAFGQSETTQKA